MRLLLISNSTMAGEPYLQYPMPEIEKFLGNNAANIIFIPYAAVTFSYDTYENKVNEQFNKINLSVKSIHRYKNQQAAIEASDAIVVGGGNTWHLVRKMHELNLMESIRKSVIANKTPYIGWSAGSNVACPTLRTTNDMPIIDPKGFDTLGLVPFQINPHYLDANPDGHAGETRAQRIEEFIEINPNDFVVGLREGSMLFVENNYIQLIGKNPCRIFKKGSIAKDYFNKDDINFLMG
ncbi:MAG TPA: dipeptidase PepE [Bacteroidales bacterium]|nr:dipeptidase PepE [Bacteroidales bacterium]